MPGAASHHGCRKSLQRHRSGDNRGPIERLTAVCIDGPLAQMNSPVIEGGQAIRMVKGVTAGLVEAAGGSIEVEQPRVAKTIRKHCNLDRYSGNIMDPACARFIFDEEPKAA